MHPQFERNLGIMSEADIQLLQNSKVAVAGCGCIGGFAAELLARMGIGALNLADPDVFDVSNINRQCAATHNTVGMKKVEALSRHLLSINPELRLHKELDGVSEDNVDAFVQDADYVIDAIDYFAFPYAVSLHRAARKFNKPIITAVALGFGTSVLAFDPKGLTLEQYIGIPEDISIEQLKNFVFPASQYTSILPSYATEDKIKEWLSNRTIPTISVGQALGPGVLVSKMVLHMLGRKEPEYVPNIFQLQFEA
jgi:molybdopterin/thiamine biosynthesis adenylyltransferase